MSRPLMILVSVLILIGGSARAQLTNGASGMLSSEQVNTPAHHRTIRPHVKTRGPRGSPTTPRAPR